MLKPPFTWDHYSDQPYPLKDKNYKNKMRRVHIWDTFPLLLSTLLWFPISVLLMPFLKGKKIEKKDFYGLGVNLDKGEIQKELLDELGVKHLLVRMPLWEMDKIDEYVEFVRSFGEEKYILLNILQDREHIEDSALLQKDMEILFIKFSPYVVEYQIGNAINRTKWGFFSTGEYLQWYEKIQKIRDKKFPHLKLIGSSVIDFEYHYTIRTLFNFFPLKYDKFSALLYVDRRGDPSNAQMGIFDTKNKIDMLYALVRLSPKTANDIYITEVNWPLSGTAPYAPTSELECVSEEKYTKYMVSYYDIALKSKKIQRVYWHQLVAPGYGLVDNSNGQIRKTKAFYAYKNMIKENNADF